MTMHAVGKTLLSTITLATVLCFGPRAHAADAPAPTTPTTDSSAQRPGAGQGGVFLTGKVGGLVPFGGLGPNVTGGLDLGYALKMGLAFGVAVDYAAPKKSGTENDARVTGGTYGWHLTEQELQVMPFVMYRITSLGALVPYGGVGLRMYFLKSTVRSSDGTNPSFQETTEKGTKIGVGVPLGIEYALGPGAFVAELLLHYGGINHTATGASNVGAASLAIGYRMMF